MAISAEEILAEIGPFKRLDAHDGVVNVIDTLMATLCCLRRWLQRLFLDSNDCNANFLLTNETETVNDVIFVNGELPEYMRDFIKKKMEKEASEANTTGGDDYSRR